MKRVASIAFITRYRNNAVKVARYSLIVSWLLSVYVACLMAVLLTVVAHRGQAQLAELGATKITLLQAMKLLQQQVVLEELNSEWIYADEECSIRARNSRLDPEASKAVRAECIDEYTVQHKSRQEELANLSAELDKIGIEVQNIAIEMPLSRLDVLRGSLDLLIFAPFTLITLLLCIAMGALGSAMHMAQELMKDPYEKSIVWYLFRPFLGIMLALATFILFKSGQVVLTVLPGANSAATEVGLNPFIVSFVAIISGMLSEQAYRKISDAGSQIFAVRETSSPRWCRPKVAAEALRKVGKTEADFAPFANSDEMTVKSWFVASKPVSPTDQAIMAAYLDVPLWELFTDQRPCPTEVGHAELGTGRDATVTDKHDM